LSWALANVSAEAEKAIVANSDARTSFFMMSVLALIDNLIEQKSRSMAQKSYDSYARYSKCYEVVQE
jgi:hypothetical protein